jgi:hypothetical protein
MDFSSSTVYLFHAAAKVGGYCVHVGSCGELQYVLQAKDHEAAGRIPHPLPSGYQTSHCLYWQG